MGSTQLARPLSRLLLAAVMLAAGLAAGLGAMAVASDGSGETYYACVNNSSGTIKMTSEADTCANNEERIVWNQHGPQGPAGPQGDPGDSGPPGSSGSSRVYTSRTQATQQTGWDLVIGDSYRLAIGELSVPAGNYVIHFEAGFQNWTLDDHPRTVSCELAGRPGQYVFQLDRPHAPGSTGVFAGHTVQTFVHPTRISLDCWVISAKDGMDGKGAEVTPFDTRITAIQVDAVNE